MGSPTETPPTTYSSRPSRYPWRWLAERAQEVEGRAQARPW